MKCECGKSQIPNEKPEPNCDLVKCPFCNRRYTYVKVYDKKTDSITFRLKK